MAVLAPSSSAYRQLTVSSALSLLMVMVGVSAMKRDATAAPPAACRGQRQQEVDGTAADVSVSVCVDWRPRG